MNYEVGDWVTDGYEIWKHKDNCRALKEVQETWVKWEPKDGELCVFYDYDSEEYIIGRYNTRHEINAFSLAEDYFYYDEDTWDNIAPLEILEELKSKR